MFIKLYLLLFLKLQPPLEKMPKIWKKLTLEVTPDSQQENYV